MLQLEFVELWVISRLFVNNDGTTIAMILEDHFKTKVLINLFFDDKALIKVVNGNLANFIDSPGKWTTFKDFHLLFEKWNSEIHSLLRFIRDMRVGFQLKIYP